MKTVVTFCAVLLVAQSLLPLSKAFHVIQVAPRRYERPTTTRLAAFDVGGAIDSFYENSPYVSAFLTCSFKASAADWIAQKKSVEEEDAPTTTNTNWQEEEENQVDISRNLAFVCYGGIYQGLWQQFMYSDLYPNLFGHFDSLPEWQSIALQVGVDMTLIGPFLCLPMAYAVKSIFTSSDSNSLEACLASVEKGLKKYTEDVFERNLLLKYCKSKQQRMRTFEVESFKPLTNTFNSQGRYGFPYRH